MIKSLVLLQDDTLAERIQERLAVGVTTEQASGLFHLEKDCAMSKTLCKASKKRTTHDAEKVAEHQAKGKPVYQCSRCQRMSHKEDHLCKPQLVKSVPPAPPAPLDVTPDPCIDKPALCAEPGVSV